ncbi:MAG TPA: Ig-like domain repeat protein [Marmoricola sp.]
MSSTHTHPGRRPAWAVTATGAMVAALFTFTPGAAHADDPVVAPALQWKISDYFDTSYSLSNHTLADGATEADDGVITFPDGVGSYNSSNGAAAITYDGSVSAGMSGMFEVTIADPRVVVDADGEGFVSAVVSSSNIASGPYAAGITEPKRVVVTTFDATGRWTSGDARRTLNATPRWHDVVVANSAEAQEAGISDGTDDKPVDGASFAPSFVAQLSPGVKPYFYKSSTAESQEAKAPSGFEAAADPMSVQADVTGVDPEAGVAVNVAGHGFTGDTNSGDAGVYVGVAPSGGLPDVSSPSGMASFAAATWIPGGAIAGGTFETSLAVPSDQLDSTKTYSVYTWQAHTHSNASQDTETPVAIDFSKLQPPAPEKSTPSVAVSGPTASKFGTKKSFTVRVSGATGTVRATGAGKALTKKLASGKAVFALPRTLAAGKHTVTFAYAGDDTHRGASKKVVVRVAKAAAHVKTTIKSRATVKKRGALQVRVTGVTGAPRPAGRVKVVLHKGKVTRTVSAKLKANGSVTVTLPKLKKGTWKVRASYLGSNNFAKAAKTTKIKVKGKK